MFSHRFPKETHYYMPLIELDLIPGVIKLESEILC